MKTYFYPLGLPLYLMDWDKAESLLEAGDELWDRHTELDRKYICYEWLDGGAFWSLGPALVESSLMDKAGLGEGTFVKDYIKYLCENIDDLKRSEKTFNKNMKENTWRSDISVELRLFKKDEVIKKFEDEFASLLEDYQNLLSEVQTLQEI